MADHISARSQHLPYILESCANIEQIRQDLYGQHDIDAVRLETACFKDSRTGDEIQRSAFQYLTEGHAFLDAGFKNIHSENMDTPRSGKIKGINAGAAAKIQHFFPWDVAKRFCDQPRSHSGGQIDKAEQADVGAFKWFPPGRLSIFASERLPKNQSIPQP